MLLALTADFTLALKTEAVVGIGKKAIKDVSAPGIDEDDQEGRLGMDAGHSRERFADEMCRSLTVAGTKKIAAENTSMRMWSNRFVEMVVYGL